MRDHKLGVLKQYQFILHSQKFGQGYISSKDLGKNPCRWELLEVAGITLLPAPSSIFKVGYSKV